MGGEAYHCWGRCVLVPCSWAPAHRQREWDWDSSEPAQEGELEGGREGGREGEGEREGGKGRERGRDGGGRERGREKVNRM